MGAEQPVGRISSRLDERRKTGLRGRFAFSECHNAHMEHRSPFSSQQTTPSPPFRPFTLSAPLQTTNAHPQSHVKAPCYVNSCASKHVVFLCPCPSLFPLVVSCLISFFAAGNTLKQCVLVLHALATNAKTKRSLDKTNHDPFCSWNHWIVLSCRLLSSLSSSALCGPGNGNNMTWKTWKWFPAQFNSNRIGHRDQKKKDRIYFQPVSCWRMCFLCVWVCICFLPSPLFPSD